MAAQLPRCVTDPLGTVSSLFDAAVASPAAGAPSVRASTPTARAGALDGTNITRCPGQGKIT